VIPGRRLVPLAAALAGAAYGLHRLVDPDLPQQIAVGREILFGRAPIGVSTFVHPFPGFAYVEDKWLASALVAAIDRAFGTSGLMAWQIALCALVAVGWLALLRRAGARPAAALAGTALLLVASAYRLEPRPDTLSHALLAAVVVAVAGGLPWVRLRWLVPATVGLWIQFHGYFVNGLLVLVAATVAGAVGDRRGAIGEEGAGTALRRGALVLALAVMACLTHPQGWRALAWPVEQLRLLSSEPALRSALTEFVPTRELFGGTGAATVALLVAAPLAGFLLALRRGGSPAAWRGAAALVVFLGVVALPPAAASAWPYRLSLAFAVAAWVEAPSAWREGRRLEVLLLSGFTVLAVPMIRNLSLVPPVAAMLVVPALQAAWDRLGARREAGAALVAGVVVLAVGARLADRLPPGTYRAPGWTGWGWDAARFPIGATAFVVREGVPGELLNNFDTSGWLLRELHPTRTVFVSDNTSMYPASFLKEYRERVMAGLEDPEALHARYGVAVAILDHAAMETPALVARLARTPAWRLVFLDRAAAVWVRDPDRSRTPVDLAAAQAALAAQAGASRGPLPWSARRLFPEMNLGIFFRAAGRPDLALREADRMWAAGAEPEIATFAAASAEEAGSLPGQVERLEQAYARFGGGASVDRWLARARFVRGLGLAEEGRLGEAIADLERSWALAPGVPGTALALARVEVEAGREASALDHLRRALEPGADPALRRAAAEDPRIAPLLRRLESD
jgi:tetratricopeptide (TPR) repeat protein